MSDFLAKRRDALENQFFAAKNAELLAKLKNEEEKKGAVEALGNATGIDDQKLLRQLVDLGIHTETVAAITIVPFLEVAWADRRIEAAEREAVLEAALENGVMPGSTAEKLLKSWLEEPFPENPISAWYDYMKELCPKLNDEQKAKLMTQIVDRAERIASAAGGILGIGGISAAERQVLNNLKAVFE